MRSGLSALLALCGVSACVPTHTVPRGDTIHSRAVPGREKVINTYASWNGSSCAPNPAPRIAVNSQPGHGTVAIRPGTTTIRKVREGGSQACLGVTMPGTTVAYTSAPGFQGTDTFDYTITSLNGIFHDTAVLDVQ